jgi:superfamily II DNA/RNA helicase
MDSIGAAIRLRTSRRPTRDHASVGKRTTEHTLAASRPQGDGNIPDSQGFAELGVSAPITKALTKSGITTPFPIQSFAIPTAASGRDLLAKSPTGSGKTLAFLVPALDRIGATTGALTFLVLAPTRELAAQIEEQAAPLAKAIGLRTAVVVGGTPIERQIAKAKKAEVLIATPGRLIDLLGRKSVDLRSVEVFVLDEADRMLDMGFKPQVDRIVAMLPKDRQTMLFSATLDGEVGEIGRAYTSDAARIHAESATEEDIDVEHRFVPVASTGAKLDALLEILAADESELTLVFSRTKHGVKRLRRRLDQRGVSAAALHGDMTQAGRQRALGEFSRGKVKVMVATDIAARGIDIEGMARVVHYDAPTTREDFVHRSGRTGRAGQAGTCITLVMDSEEADMSRLAAICGLEEEYKAAGLKVAPPRTVAGRRGRKTGARRSTRPAPAPTPDRGNRVRRRSAPRPA